VSIVVTWPFARVSCWVRTMPSAAKAVVAEKVSAAAMAIVEWIHEGSPVG
jgi:hypothetical protein